MKYLIKAMFYDNYARLLTQFKSGEIDVFAIRALFSGEYYADVLLQNMALFKPQFDDALVSFFEGYLTTIEKSELMILALPLERIDGDVLPVIQMRQNKLGQQLVVMPCFVLEMMLLRQSVFPEVTKLSFLHHHSQRLLQMTGEPSYIQFLPLMVQKFPNLTDVVLRGCAASFPGPEKIAPYKVKVIPSKTDINQVQGDFIFQQIKKDDDTAQHNTWLRFNRTVMLAIDIPWNDHQKNLSLEVQQALYRLMTTGKIPPLALPYAAEQKANFLDENKRIDRITKTHVKKTSSLQTFSQENFPTSRDERDIPSLAQRSHAVLKSAGYQGRIKAYTGAYKALPDRIIPLRHDNTYTAIRVPETGHEKLPKRSQKPLMLASFFTGRNLYWDPPFIEMTKQCNFQLLINSGATTPLIDDCVKQMGEEAFSNLLIQPPHIIAGLLSHVSFPKLYFCLDSVVKQSVFTEVLFHQLKTLLDCKIAFSCITSMSVEKGLFYIRHADLIAVLLRHNTIETILPFSLDKLQHISEYYTVYDHWQGKDFCWKTFFNLSKSFLDDLKVYCYATAQKGAVRLGWYANFETLLNLPGNVRSAFIKNPLNAEVLLEESHREGISFTNLCKNYPHQLLIAYLNSTPDDKYTLFVTPRDELLREIRRLFRSTVAPQPF